MKLTERDLELFKALSKSAIGTDLADYLQRLEAYICDSRSWGENDTKESALHAAGKIKELRSRIYQAPAQPQQPTNFD